MYWLLIFIGLFCLWMLYIITKAERELSKVIDTNTGKPIQRGHGALKFIVEMIKYWTDGPVAHFRGQSAKFGSIYTTYNFLFGFSTVTFTDPEDIKNILKRIDEFKKSNFLYQPHMKYLIGEKNIVNANNPEWHEQRKLLNPAFVASSVFFQPMLKKVQLIIDRWEKEQKVKIIHDLQKFTLDVLATCIFGLEFDTLNGKIAEPLLAYNYAMESGFHPIRLMLSFVNKLPIESNRRLSYYLNLYDKYIWDIMETTKQKMEVKKQKGMSDISETRSLIELMYENNLDETLIRENISIFFFAGHETTAANLSWLISILATHPEIQEKARNEVLEKIPDELNFEILKELHYIEGLIKETLRIYPTVVSIARNVAEDCTVGHVRLPKGSIVLLDFVTMSYDAKVWGDPLNVRPERWFAENMTKEQRNSWMPFSTGPRICIGMNFSLLEQKIFLVVLLKRFKQIKLAPNAEIKQKMGGIVLSPDSEKLIIDFRN